MPVSDNLLLVLGAFLSALILSVGGCGPDRLCRVRFACPSTAGYWNQPNLGVQLWLCGRMPGGGLLL